MIESKTILKIVGVVILLVILYKVYSVAEENDYWFFATEDKIVIVDKTESDGKIELGKNDTEVEKPKGEKNIVEVDYGKYTGNYENNAPEKTDVNYKSNQGSESTFSEEEYFNADYSWKKKTKTLETYAGPADSDGTGFAPQDGIKDVIRINVDFKDSYGVLVNSPEPAITRITMWAVDPYALDPLDKSAELGKIYTSKFYKEKATDLAYSVPLGNSGLFVRYKEMDFGPFKYIGSGEEEYTKIKIKVELITGPEDAIEETKVFNFFKKELGQ